VTEETMTLRDAARRLARSKNSKAKGIQSSNLLSLLKSGEFRRIGLKPDDPRSGTYKIRAVTIPDQVARIICKAIATSQQPSGGHQTLGVVTAVVDAAARSYEVVVKTSSWSIWKLIGPKRE
jgi:hypothetical protein